MYNGKVATILKISLLIRTAWLGDQCYAQQHLLHHHSDSHSGGQPVTDTPWYIDDLAFSALVL